jgi:hypothetical protein
MYAPRIQEVSTSFSKYATKIQGVSICCSKYTPRIQGVSICCSKDARRIQGDSDIKVHPYNTGVSEIRGYILLALYGMKVAVSQLPSYHTVPATTLRNPARHINRTLYHML